MIEALARLVPDLSAVHVRRKIRNPTQLLCIERPLVHAAFDHVLPQLPPGQMVKHQAIFAGVDSFSFIKRPELSGEVCLPGQIP